MNNTSIRNELHQLIDSIEDELMLSDYYRFIKLNAGSKSDILDELNEDQILRLRSSQEQMSNSNGTPDKLVRERFKKWLT